MKERVKMTTEVHLGDCLEVLKNMGSESIDLVYLDPPFCTQKTQTLGTRDRKRKYQFADTWTSLGEYAEFLHVRLTELHRVLRSTGSLFFHCDRNASHVARLLLDGIFGSERFLAEIVWYYRRWSNARKNLLPAHQNILFYSKAATYKFNTLMQSYSPATNVDQILQKRGRDRFGKAVYARDENGNTIPIGIKKGVPLGDVWDIPFLNPKAKERTGYPTQKPVLLLERIVRVATDKGGMVLDPFCGSGTTLVAAELLGRDSIGIDISPEAVSITRQRLKDPVRSTSRVLRVGRRSYESASEYALAFLSGLDFVPVHRNKGIDALLPVEYKGGPVPVRVQRPGETLSDAAESLSRASTTKHAHAMILLSTQETLDLGIHPSLPDDVIVVESTARAVRKIVRRLMHQEEHAATVNAS